MKKFTIIFTVLIVTAISANAQVIPNYNFENWSNGANSAPDGWTGLPGGYLSGFYEVTQSTDHFLGSYSVRLENKVTVTDTIAGRMITAIDNNHAWKPAFPVNFRYSTLKGFYKFIPQNGDSAMVVAQLFKTGYANSYGYGSMLGGGVGMMGAASVFTPFSSQAFSYDNGTVIPDSAFIALVAYKLFDPILGISLMPKGNSVLYVDALNFDTYLTGISEPLDITSNFKLFPNVTDGNFDVRFETSENEYTTIKIYDMEGREIRNLFSGSLNSGNHEFHYSMQELNNGNYLYVVASGKGYRAEKLLIQK